jgi:hypothetical protein
MTAGALTWHRTSAYSIASAEGDYAVCRTVGLDTHSGELVERFSAWYGLDLLEQPRETAHPAELLGIRPSAAAAKALCVAHRGRSGFSPTAQGI